MRVSGAYDSNHILFMSLKILLCSSSCVIPPFSRREYHLPSCCIHCERICSHILGEATLELGLGSGSPLGLAKLGGSATELLLAQPRKNGRSGG